MNYPIGIQSFKEIREGGYAYVDKTDLVYDLVKQGKYYLFTRPSRFGKSLLLSTLEAYFEGRKELFNGLAISELEKNWISYPVIHLDLSNGTYNSIESLTDHLNFMLAEQEKRFNLPQADTPPYQRFYDIIRNISQKVGRDVAVLIDEYDKPFLETLDKPELRENIGRELQTFYSVIKSSGNYLHFAMLTGVTKISLASEFSGLNNLNNITFYSDYAAICGFTDEEMVSYFAEPIKNMADEKGCSADEMLKAIHNKYYGYRFSNSELHVYNPFSILNVIKNRELRPYWLETETPKYLIELMQRNCYDISAIDGAVTDSRHLSNMDPDSYDPIPVIYQSGYLTVKSYSRKYNDITLGFPNEDVRIGLMEYAYPCYTKLKDGKMVPFLCLKNEIENGKAESFMQILQDLSVNLLYNTLKRCEDDFINFIYIIFSLASITSVKVHRSFDGRIDMLVETDNFVYVMEFKVDGSAQEAMDQIESKQYALPWSTDHRKVIKIGANFSTTERRLTDYVIR